MEDSNKFESWSLVEVMGHSRYAGWVTEQSIGGASFVRVDVPESDGRRAFTKFLGSSAIFSITPVTEEIARGLAKSFRNEPVSVYDLPPELRRPALAHVPEGANVEDPEVDEGWGDEDDEDPL